MTFDQLGLPPSIAAALKQMNFITPTPIQAQCIPEAIKGRDIMGMAQTGTGKTGAFGIPMAIRLMDNPGENALVLAPTRELAMQIHAFIKEVAGKNFNLRPALIIGGQSMKQQLRELRDNPRILICTPGRLVDHLRSFPKMLAKSSILVLDEADRMMDMGFMPQIRVILKGLPRNRQTMMFSATYPNDIKALANDYLRDPAKISIGESSKPIEKIEQAVIETTQKQKNDVLLDELNVRKGSVLIFTRTKHRTDRLGKFLESYGHKCARIHGNRTQGQRKMAIEGFRAGHFRILVATDIASRGLDIANIAHVINYDLPQVPEDYIHRIGRTARNGNEGKSLALLVPEDRQMWQQISRINTKGVGSQQAAPSMAGGYDDKAAAQVRHQRAQEKRDRPQRTFDGSQRSTNNNQPRSGGGGTGDPRPQQKRWGRNGGGSGGKKFGGGPSRGGHGQRSNGGGSGGQGQRSSGGTGGGSSGGGQKSTSSTSRW